VRDLGGEPAAVGRHRTVGFLARGLARLNAAIAATGAPLFGNLCYDHLEEDFAQSPPNPILRSKRDRLRRAVEGRTRMLEVGVNGGHSAYVG
jgi:hypothetical protein